MSAEISSQQIRSKSKDCEQELRIIPLHSHESNHIIIPHNNRLPRGFLQAGENFEQTARRVAIDQLNLSGLKTVARLNHETGVSAHVVEAAHGVKTNLRNGFAARAIDLSIFLDDMYADRYDEIDFAFIQALASRRLREE